LKGRDLKGRDLKGRDLKGRAVEDILEFPDGFAWGVATSAFQCEGAATSPHSSWTRWEALGHIRAGNRSGVACDWWENAERDLDGWQAT